MPVPLLCFVYAVGGMLAYVLAGYLGVALVMGIVTAGFIVGHVRYRLTQRRR